MKKIICLTLLVFIFSSSYSVHDIEIYLVGLRLGTTSIDPPYIDKIQKDQYVLFYQIRSQTMDSVKLKKYNEHLWKYQYNLDFPFFNTSYHEVYYAGTYQPRKLKFSTSGYPIHIKKSDLLYNPSYDSILYSQYNEHRNRVFLNYPLDSLANVNADTFYISKNLPLNQRSKISESDAIAFNFGKCRYIYITEYVLECDSVSIHLISDSVLFIANNEFSVILNLNINPSANEYLELSLYDEIDVNLKKEYLFFVMSKLYDEPYPFTDYGESRRVFDFDLFPMLVEFYSETSQTNFLSFWFYNDSSPFDRYEKRGNSVFIRFEEIEPFLKKNSILHEINKLYIK